MNLPIKHKLQKGKYQIVEIIGQGGFGITYKAIWHTEVKGNLGKVATNIPICIKEYFFKDYCYRDEHTCFVKNYSENAGSLFERFKERLIREAKILSKLQHPNIVNVLEVFEENNTAYIAMEYIEGLSLKEIMEQRGTHLPLNEAAHYIKGIANALAFIHEKNITHFDIKPSNIIINQSGDAQLIDFGVSRDYEIENLHTSTTMLSLSKGYAAIEQYDGDAIKSFSPLPDIYALGATFYNLLTGLTPTESILRVTRPIEAPSEINAELSPEIDQVILKAMSILPEDRYQSIKEFLNALESVNIPSFEFKQTASPLSSNKKQTKLKSNDSEIEENKTSNFEEETILANKNDIGIKNSSNSQLEKRTSKPSKMKTLAFLLIMSVIALTITYSLIFLRKNPEISSQTQVSDSLEIIHNTLLEKPKDLNKDTFSVKEPTEDKIENPSPKSKIETNIKQEKSKQEENLKPNVKDDTSKSSEQEEIEKKKRKEKELAYKKLLNEAKLLIEKEDYPSAITALEKAKNIMFTEDVISLILKTKEKQKQKEQNKRKALYEEKMRFGNLLIVRKKDNGNYGAIDFEFKEVIPCIYISIGISGENRAFERPDHLFDIYSSKGKLLEKGRTDY